VAVPCRILSTATRLIGSELAQGPAVHPRARGGAAAWAGNGTRPPRDFYCSLKIVDERNGAARGSKEVSSREPGAGAPGCRFSPL
jgi:hypothetical protein